MRSGVSFEHFIFSGFVNNDYLTEWNQQNEQWEEVEIYWGVDHSDKLVEP